MVGIFAQNLQQERPVNAAKLLGPEALLNRCPPQLLEIVIDQFGVQLDPLESTKRECNQLYENVGGMSVVIYLLELAFDLLTRTSHLDEV